MEKKSIHDIFLYLCRLQDEYTIVTYLEKDVSVNDTDDEGISLLHLASANGAERIVKLLLLKGAEVDKYTTLGWTPLMFAARNGCLQCVKLLVDHGANIYHRNKLGISILNMASASGSQDVLGILLIATEQKALEQDDIIFSLQVAALYGHSCILHALLRSYLHQVNNKDKYGMTPLMLATVGGHKEVIKLILDHGADQEKRKVVIEIYAAKILHLEMLVQTWLNPTVGHQFVPQSEEKGLKVSFRIITPTPVMLLK